jgi:DNA-binding NarL/FixJ family response regulator
MNESPRLAHPRNDGVGSGRATTSITILALLSDEESRERIRIAARDLGDKLLLARDVHEAIHLASSEEIHLAVIDLSVDEGMGVALVHHVPAISPGARVVVASTRADITRAADAIAVGADAVYPLPLTGDAVVTTIGAARERIVEARERRAFAIELAGERRRRELRDRILRRAQRGENVEAATALVDGLVEQGAARGVALYCEVPGPNGTSVHERVAQAGSLTSLPARTADLLELGRKSSLFIWSLPVAGDDLGALVADEPTDERLVTSMIELASVVLALSSRASRRNETVSDAFPAGLLYTSAYLRVLGPRELDRAKRHGKSLSFLALTGTPTRDVAPALLETLRSSDVLAEATPDVLVVVLPDTGAFGAAACRKRLFARISGDPRARPAHAAHLRAGASPAGLGTASYPHDGEDLDTLLDLAIDRARADEASVVHGLELGSKTLGEIVDTLRARPAMQAGPRSTYPLDLSIGALSQLVEHACAAARRSASTAFFSTHHPGRGLAGAVRSLAPTPLGEAPPSARRDRHERRAKRHTGHDVEVRDVRHLPGGLDAFAVVVRADHGTWVALGRLENDRFVGVHAADPLLADLVADRILLGALPEGEGERR